MPPVLALSSWSLHTEFLNPPSSNLRAEDFPSLARNVFGVRNIEYYESDYAANFLANTIDDAYARRIRKACDQAGVRVVCIAAINDLTTPNNDLDLTRLRKWGRHCEILGCSILRINTGRRRLDQTGFESLRTKLCLLADEWPKITFAVENHPQILSVKTDAEHLAMLITSSRRPNVRACPDVGAILPGAWPEALEVLAPLAAHVHLKATIRSRDGRSIDLHEFGPQLRTILEKVAFGGALSMEYTEFMDLAANPYARTRVYMDQASQIFGCSLESPTSSLPRSKPASKALVNLDPELTPSAGILQLLTDGCELQLGAQIRIYDFASEREVYSQTACHRNGALPARSRDASKHFCEIADADPIIAPKCQNFYQKKLELIKDGFLDEARICICPMGLTLLSVPVKDENYIYGTIACGPWIEKGAEGMVTDSIAFGASQDSKSHLETASYKLESFAIDRIVRSKDLLLSLAQDLASIYRQRFEEKKYLTQGAEIINELCEQGLRQPDEYHFIGAIVPYFERFAELLGFGSFGLYQLHEDLFRLVSFSTSGFPAEIKVGGIDRMEWRGFLVDRITDFTIEACFSPARVECDEVLVFRYPKGKPFSTDRQTMTAQFMIEVEISLAYLRSISESKKRKEDLEILFDRLRHALSAPFQGISDRVLQLRALADGKLNERALVPASLDAKEMERFSRLMNDMGAFVTQSGGILNRLTRRVRLTGHGMLRPSYEFVTVDYEAFLDESIRKWARVAKRRQVSYIRKGFHSDEASARKVMEADLSALRELFDNLIENAQKFSNDGMPVIVSCQDWSAVPTWILGEPGFRLTIEDRGLGIPADECAKIFLPYVQGKQQPKGRVVGGTGLGLAICKDIVEQHNGRIEVTSEFLTRASSDIQNCLVRFSVDLPYVHSGRQTTDGNFS